MKCTRCDKEAEYIINGESVCKDHKDEDKEAEKTAGQIMTGI